MTLTNAIAVVLGAALGLAYVATLRWNVRLYVAGNAGFAIMLHVARFLGVALALGIAVRSGASALLAATLGFTVARFVAVRREVR